jgi:hypothetical protein
MRPQHSQRRGVAPLSAVILSAAIFGSVGCGKNVMPTKAVLTPYEHARDFSVVQYSGAKYTSGNHYTDAPVLPFMGFGADFDLDIVVGLKDDRWDMIEVAKVRRPNDDGSARPMWIVLESRAGSKEQSIVANVDDINTWMPELPLARKSGGLQVEDRTTADGIDIRVKYDNIDNQPVELVLQGDPPDKASKKRNGNTMGHSANDLLAVLDVSSMESLFKADVRIDDRPVRSRKVAAIVPMRFAMTQTQGGVARGEYWQQLTDTMPLVEDAAFAVGSKWEPPPPPPEPPTIPEPVNPAGDEVVLLDFAEWELLDEKVATKAVEANETQLDVCLTPALIEDPAYKGLVVVDFHVKGGKPWEITVNPESTASELVMSCAQQTIAEWTFDAKLDGAIRLDYGVFPADHEPVNDLEKAWLEANPPEAMDEEEEEAAPEEEASEDELPEEGDDLLDGDDGVSLGMEEEDMGESVLQAFNTIHRMPDGTDVSQSWTVDQDGGRVWVTQDSGTRKMTYEYLIFGKDALELRSIRVENWGSPVPSFAMTFTPALPDLGRPFSGKVQSKFVMDVGGQLGHATGTVISESGDQSAKVQIKPDAPSWAADRPMVSEITFDEGTPKVITRIAN